MQLQIKVSIFYRVHVSDTNRVHHVPPVLRARPPPLRPHLPPHPDVCHRRSPLHRRPQRVRSAASRHHHQPGVDSSNRIVDVSRFYFACRWISEMAEAKVMCASKIGILSHSLLNVYENAMVSKYFS